MDIYDLKISLFNIKFKYIFPFSDYIRAICLPLATEASRIGENLIVSGWGRTERLSRSPIKQKLRVPIADKSNCTRTFSTAGVRLGNNQICAGGIAGKDSCTGNKNMTTILRAKDEY